ncbi:pyruvate formate-lyase-activating protein [Inediibacterium massiliense]|uniref:pyruvate formate-lyase-activating protein n=1 Tax=Inediibacterium massiliense TaxID=1658111 RepID=UPI0006B431A4|nr:pyruvate formate-lyase-activating protein [Inediibacterium massiliense]
MGRIHSYESMGLVDGPGIRFVVFFQGCTLRCMYCHNPDTWDFKKGIEISPKDLFTKVLRYKPYFGKTGGVTCSGGEPLMQPDFLMEFFKLCKEHNIHTVLDTAGVGVGNYEEILSYTDLILLDIKHVTKYGYEKITGKDMNAFQEFFKIVCKKNIPMWMRQVIVPEITDTYKYLDELKSFVKEIPNVEKIELLPYHKLGVNKYKEMNIPYKLDHIDAMSPEKMIEVKKYFYDV